MATINNRELVDGIIKNNGYYEDDLRVVKVVQYENSFNGALAYGLIYEREDLDRYHESQFIRNPITLWEA